MLLAMLLLSLLPGTYVPFIVPVPLRAPIVAAPAAEDVEEEEEEMEEEEAPGWLSIRPQAWGRAEDSVASEDVVAKSKSTSTGELPRTCSIRRELSRIWGTIDNDDDEEEEAEEEEEVAEENVGDVERKAGEPNDNGFLGFGPTTSINGDVPIGNEA